MISFIAFIVLIGVLIFIHELGHFLTAKLLGVKVLTFSLGFPPRLVGRRFGETEYVLGAIPLGGYVKFLGEDATEEVPKQDLARAFPYQPIWKRMVIVLAGPFMNLIFPLFIYFIVFAFQPKVTPPVVGMLLPGGPAEAAGLLPGDSITEIDGKSIKAFDDLREAVGDKMGKTVTVVFTRDGKRMEREVKVERHVETLPLDLKKEVGRIGIYPEFRLPIIQVPNTNSPAYRSGLRTGDLVLSFGGKPVKRWDDLRAMPLPEKGEVQVLLLRPQETKTAAGSVYIYTLKEVMLHVEGPPACPTGELECSGPMRTGIDTSELYISTVTKGSVAEKIGLVPGDRILRLGGKRVGLWDQLEASLKAFPEAFHTIEVLRQDGSILSAHFKLSKTTTVDPLKQLQITYVFGASNYSIYKEEEPIPNPDPIRRAVKGAVKEATSVITLTFIGIVRIFQGKISSKTLGGPIMIFDITGKAAKKGLSSFLWIMAIISINLAIINLVPIPMLDGGLILLFLVELVRRKAPGTTFRLIYQYVGLVLIGLLILFVFKNDIERYWDSIVDFFRRQ